MGSYVSKDVVPHDLWDQVKTSQGVSYAREHPWIVMGGLTAGYVLWDYIGWRLLAPKLPPGPIGLPLIGNLFQMEDLKQVGKKYGDVFMMRILSKKVIILNNVDTIKEAFVKRGVEFSDRPQKEGVSSLLDLHDDIFTKNYSAEWQASKKFAGKALRSFGIGTNAIEEKNQTEVDKICDVIAGHNGVPMNLAPLIPKGASNVIHSILFNFQLTFDDPKVTRAVNLSKSILDAFLEAFMWGLLPNWVTRLFASGFRRRSKEAFDKQREVIQEEIAEHRATFDPNNLRDFLDVYLKDRPDMDELVLTDTMMAFYNDAIHTLSLIVTWVLVSIIHRPEVQKRIQEELDSVVGRSRKPSLEDRSKLTYLDATIMEVMRMYDFIPFIPEHVPRESTTLRGYHIPKGVFLWANVSAVHKDPNVFPEPYTFRPDHFLDQNGKLINTGNYIPFGAGPRMCMGEKLAKQEIFLFVANIFHRFKLKFAEGKQHPPKDPIEEIFSVDMTCYLCAEER